MSEIRRTLPTPACEVWLPIFLREAGVMFEGN
jgi:hypothetical protein